MAEVQEHDSGKKKKGAQKKMTIRVDFTPMVDMNMLLITFFMLCTTMIKSQTLKITLPTNESNIEKESMSQAKESEALTLILDTEWDADGKPLTVDGKTVHSIYWYPGKPSDSVSVKKETFIGNSPTRDANGNVVRQGIRKILYERNEDVMENYLKLKAEMKRDNKPQEWLDSMAKINSKGLLAEKGGHWVELDSAEAISRPVVIIKPGPNATYEALISALDEMSINQIARYNINPTTGMDTMLLKKYGYDNFGDSLAIIRPDIRPDKKN